MASSFPTNKILEIEPKILIVSSPIPLHNRAGIEILLNFLKILKPISKEIYIVTGNMNFAGIDESNIFIKDLKYRSVFKSIICRTVNYIVFQIKVLIIILSLSRKKIDIVLYFRGSSLVIPILFTKFLRMKTIIVITGSQAKSSNMTLQSQFLITKLLENLELFSYKMADKMIVYSKSIITDYNLSKYDQKILSYGARFVDGDKFLINKKIHSRSKIIGYIGRFSEEKGIINFLDSIPQIFEIDSDINILIIGNGPLLSVVKERVSKNDRIKVMGWISHELLPEYLNTLKLLIVPSYTEGLPNIILEAMACGTPVLATPVGSIPDIIKDGFTGFILENNSADCISKNVLRSITYKDLDIIVNNARNLIENEYSYSNALIRYKNIFYEIMI